jgi:hypothetical protein
LFFRRPSHFFQFDFNFTQKLDRLIDDALDLTVDALLVVPPPRLAGIEAFFGVEATAGLFGDFTGTAATPDVTASLSSFFFLAPMGFLRCNRAMNHLDYPSRKETGKLSPLNFRSIAGSAEDGRPGGIRTPNTRIWSPMLYQLELLACKFLPSLSA